MYVKNRSPLALLCALCLALSLTACNLSGTLPDLTPESEPVKPAAAPVRPAATRDDSGAALDDSGTEVEPVADGVITLDALPDYGGEAYVPLNDNVPDFDPDDLPPRSFEEYSELDALGRCGVAFANVGLDLMPTEKRGSIGQVKPSGWKTVQYDIVDGKYLYNRCHLIGYQLTAENANKQNLITGTRYLNVQGMLPFENLVADYIKETGNHVLYRVTPIFEGDNLVADGVQIEAMSVEDKGEGVLFNVYCYNVQPGIVIDYATGDSALADAAPVADAEAVLYVVNIKTGKFHYPNCSSAVNMTASVREEFTGTRDELIAAGYEPCGRCKP